VRGDGGDASAGAAPWYAAVGKGGGIAAIDANGGGVTSACAAVSEF